MLKIGHVLKDRYVIERHLGKGGMGSVYLATDRTFGSKVALKETIVQGGGLEEAFEREARVLNKLRHGAIPVVMDYFIEDDGRFLVMQYIPGDDLSTLIERTKKPFAVERILEWADKLLDALTYLHTQDPPIIHRDIKPQNLKLTDREEIVLLDFGLSKAATGGEAAQNQSIAGYTPNYAPIEQIQLAGTDARTDLFSLAATLYHLLTGAKPVDAIRRLVTKPDPLRPVHELNPAVSRQVSDVLMAALSVQPERRPATAAEMRAELRGAAFDDLLSLAQGFDSDDSSPRPQPVVVASEVPDDQLPTVLPGQPAAQPTAEVRTVVLPTDAVVEAPQPYLETVVTPVVAGFGSAPAHVPQPAAPPPPAPPRERNTKPPSTVSLVYEAVTLADDGTVASRKKMRAKQYFEGTGEGASVAMVEVPAGEFEFGSPDDEDGRDDAEGPTSSVEIGRHFVSRSPITQAQWRAVASSLPKVAIDLNPSPSQFAGDDRPVDTVSWDEAREFCERLSAHTGRDYRLPTESEWEYACRAGTTTPFGLGPTLTVEVANVDGSIEYGKGPSGEGPQQTTAANLSVSNRFGLCDMHGNVWEWTEDRWHATLEGAPVDGSAWLDGGEPTIRVLRGGSFASIPHDARSAKRFSFLQSGRRNDVGFRIVMAPVNGG